MYGRTKLFQSFNRQYLGYLGAERLVQSARYDDAANVDRLDGYSLVGLHVQYDFAPHWWLRTKVDNLYNKQYETVKTYNSAGRSLFVSVGTQWQ